MGIDPHASSSHFIPWSRDCWRHSRAPRYSASASSSRPSISLTIKAFIITVLAGMGSIPGVLVVGALLLGITESLTTTFFSSALQELAGMLLFLFRAVRAAERPLRHALAAPWLTAASRRGLRSRSRSM
jgi:hypothetical protein